MAFGDETGAVRGVEGGQSSSVPSAEGTLRAVGAILARLSPRDFTVRLWDGRTVPPEEGSRSRFTIILTHPASLRRMVWPPGQPTAAEAFIRRDFEVEGDLVAASRLRDRIPRRGHRDLAARSSSSPRRRLRPPSAPGHRRACAATSTPASRLRRGPPPLRPRQRLLLALARPPDGLLLRLLPEPDASLDDAQEAKLELVCRKLRLAAGRAAPRHRLRLGRAVHAPRSVTASRARHHPQPAAGGVRARADRVRAGLAAPVRFELARLPRPSRRSRSTRSRASGWSSTSASQAPAYFGAARCSGPGGLFLNHGISPVVPRDDSLRSEAPARGRLRAAVRVPGRRTPFLHERRRRRSRPGSSSATSSPARALRAHPAPLARPARGAARRGGRPSGAPFRICGCTSPARRPTSSAGRTRCSSPLREAGRGRSGPPLTRNGGSS